MGWIIKLRITAHKKHSPIGECFLIMGRFNLPITTSPQFLIIYMYAINK